MLIYLDNCCFNRPFDSQGQVRVQLETEAKLGIQEEVRKGILNLAWSYILDFENEANPSVARKESIRRWRHYASVDANETSGIVEKARELLAMGFKKKDSLHLACALSVKCDIFFTTDDGILKKRQAAASIQILNPLEYYANYNH